MISTPWEEYVICDAHANYPLWVKREDLCCGGDESSPAFSKIRGVYAHLYSLEDNGHYPPIGVLDTYHSKAGRGVAWICEQMGIECHVYYPMYKAEQLDNGDYTIREHQRVARQLGAHLHGLPAGRSAILYHQAKKQFHNMTNGTGVMLPNALKLYETVSETALELWSNTPVQLLIGGTWIVSISSGTIAAGVIRGLYMPKACEIRPCIIAHMGYSRSKDAARKYMVSMAGIDPGNDLTIIDEGYSYKDKVNGYDCPFPCNEYYDAKAFLWLMDNIDTLTRPIVFWNIGA